MGKTTKKEVATRVNHIIQLLVVGATLPEICENAQVKTWEVSESQVWRYINKAYKYFEEQANVDRDKELGQILRQYQFLYLQMLRAKDYRGAGTILDKRADLIGLKTLKVDATGQMNHRVTFESKDDIEKL